MQKIGFQSVNWVYSETVLFENWFEIWEYPNICASVCVGPPCKVVFKSLNRLSVIFPYLQEKVSKLYCVIDHSRVPLRLRFFIPANGIQYKSSHSAIGTATSLLVFQKISYAPIYCDCDCNTKKKCNRNHTVNEALSNKNFFLQI